MKKMARVELSVNQSDGFTLLEMVLVLFLMGLVASAGLMLTENVEDQEKYDETKRRMAMMRQAIIGNPARTINGHPDISGFVADMGRLPGCVKELLQDEDCDGNTISGWLQDASTGVWSGWRGPYIHVIPESNGKRYFRDGYGNSDASDALNSGWDYQVSGAVEVMLTSKGADGVSSADDITDDQLITANDWRINTIQIRFVNNSSTALPASAQTVELRVVWSDKDFYKTSSSYNMTAGVIPAGSSVIVPFSFSASEAVPMGEQGYLLVCSNNNKLFDGTCTQNINYLDDVRHFTVAPRSTPVLDWIIP
ncbi:type II secretion system protein [methane-oxidizing endosymbiont of Gigantopelta aegis]|uniref:type II secretion system protein n=1 Tax=methane-oxidizing endosymbiont of Gigantopelta aegis TaxID=2794938 RepID=UPI0018DE984D|nr:type II secretion system protein [methane-oxidizing endosymbiont of Gigantopelta aegis]